MIIVSNGFNKFFLAAAASELARRGRLAALVTGAYPTSVVEKAVRLVGLAKTRKAARLLARSEPIPAELVFSDWMSEGLHVVGAGLQRSAPARTFGKFLDRKSYRWYGHRAQSIVRRAATNGASIYHYRAGFGHESVRAARACGMFTLCDHSMVHPSLDEPFVSRGGAWPQVMPARDPSQSFGRELLEDIRQADAVLVNSDFVKETFLRQGWDAQRLHVIYSGVDDAFFQVLETLGSRPAKTTEPMRIVFAGAFTVRKGASVLESALALIAEDRPTFELHVAGAISADASAAWRSLRCDPRVRYHGVLPRTELAGLFAGAPIFVFPSLAEGSARVVFEALASGCYVITTPNSGSIVEDGVHGRLVPPGDPVALAAAIRQTLALDPARLREIGANNARVVREQYRQSNYGDKLVALYAELLRIDSLTSTLEEQPLPNGHA